MEKREQIERVKQLFGITTVFNQDILIVGQIPYTYI